MTVDAGETVVVLGPNGAGKSTTLRTISGLLPLLGGTIEDCLLHVGIEESRRRTRYRDNEHCACKRGTDKAPPLGCLPWRGIPRERAECRDDAELDEHVRDIAVRATVGHPADRPAKSDGRESQGRGNDPGAAPSPGGHGPECGERYKEATEIRAKRRQSTPTNHLEAKTVRSLLGRDPQLQADTRAKQRT